jgi:hypothetical protein
LPLTLINKSKRDFFFMRMKPITIAFGDKEWSIRPLTLRQVEEIEPIVMQGGGAMPLSISIVQIALRRDHPEDSENIREFESTTAQVAAAMRAVLRLGGFLETETPGEAEPPMGAAE